MTPKHRLSIYSYFYIIFLFHSFFQIKKLFNIFVLEDIVNIDMNRNKLNEDRMKERNKKTYIKIVHEFVINEMSVNGIETKKKK